MTYEDVKAAYDREGLVDITPENLKNKSTKHFLDPQVSDVLGLKGHRFRVYYVFNPTSGKFRRRKDEIIPLGNGKKWYKRDGYPLNRRKTVYQVIEGSTLSMRQLIPHREFILEYDIVKQMQLALNPIGCYRKTHKQGI